MLMKNANEGRVGKSKGIVNVQISEKSKKKYTMQ